MDKKRPLNAYLLFCEEKRKQVLDEDPSLNHRSIMQKLGVLWKELPDEMKQPYKEKAFKLQEDFKQKNPYYHYNTKKGKPKQSQQPKFYAENILPVDPNFLMALGFQTLLRSANQTHFLNFPQFQPIAPVSMPPPPPGGKTSNARTAMLAVQLKHATNKAEVPSMPPPPGFNKPSITISMPPPPTMPPPRNDIISMPPPSHIDADIIGIRRHDQIRFAPIPSMAPPVKMPPPPPSSNIPKMPPPPTIINMPPPPASIVPKMPPPPNWN